MVRGNKDRKSGGVIRHPSRSDKSRSKSVVDKLFGTKHRTTEEVSEDCSELAPSQRCKRLRERIQHLEGEIEIKTKSKDGLARLATVYTEQPNMGNLDEVTVSLAETNRALDHLTQDLAKFKTYLEDAEDQLNVPVNVALNGGQARSPSTSIVSNGASSSPGKPHRSSLSEESISSESSVGARGRLSGQPIPPSSARSLNTQPPRPPPPMARPDIGFVDEGGSSGEYNEAEEVSDPVLGTATILYPFDGGSEGTMAVVEGEEVLLIERDEGDGWTRIRKLRSADEGFVPSSYLDSKWYPS